MAQSQVDYIKLLHQELAPAVGCTEPIAIALACAKARDVLGCSGADIERIELILSANVIKNAIGVGIPGTGMVGIHIAAALGAVGGDADKELEVITDVSEEDIQTAKKLAGAKQVSLLRSPNAQKLYVHSTVFSAGHGCEVTIAGDHRHISQIRKDGELILSRALPDAESSETEELETSVAEIFRFIEGCDIRPLDFLYEGAMMNRRIALEGLDRDYGLRVGRTIRKNIEKKIITEDMVNFAVELASAAADARMAGCMMPVMTNSGSGNQGITATLPVVAVAEKLDATREQLIRALGLSNLIAIHIRRGIGRLSALCGATTAAIGAGCGMVWLMGGALPAVGSVIKNMIGDLAGMICDGAKNSCALKVATSVESAFRSALLALDRIEVTCHEGIIEQDIEKSISNLVSISTVGMEHVDDMVLSIMEAKECDPSCRGCDDETYR
jgi:L-cysteine desulfidase